jgi:hypothetical protein
VDGRDKPGHDEGGAFILLGRLTVENGRRRLRHGRQS